MAVVRRDHVHDHHLVTDLVGTVLGIALIVLLLAATLAAAGFVLMQWVGRLSG
jgi:hypothetical protein